MDSEMQPTPSAPSDGTDIEPCPVRGCTIPVDLIIVSKDKKHISAHTSNLGQFSNGFPAPHALSELARGAVSGPEQARLEETADVLRLLLRFMHHTHLPDLDVLPFATVAGMAEAAEKYEVFSAIALGKACMKRRAENQIKPLQPHDALKVLFYALKHGYNDIADSAALRTLDVSLDQFLPLAEFAGVSQHIIRWVRYREQHQHKLQNILSWCRFNSPGPHQDDGGVSFCSQWSEFENEVIGMFTTHLSWVYKFADIVERHAERKQTFREDTLTYSDEAGFVLTCNTLPGCTIPVDLILVSRDEKCISAHTSNLGQFSNGFPAPHASIEFAQETVSGLRLLEEAHLEETGDVLRLLLWFMHHTHLPDLDALPFETVAGMAEAAEKYEVFSAIAFGKLYMMRRVENQAKPLLSHESAKVLFYALKHGYDDLADSAALGTLDLTLDLFLTQAEDEGVSPQHVIQWVSSL
ncbi:hypothetical protein CVT24_008233 [Panaeolus cyanescens]|uniref:BTB domain-containing protein n=1 Tax=Panaeolus cyanescens TaxID=181874 RepID=A0A409YR24_9AGAR|nr:hypothetical protein CVT24_008233 [Panaeolus cyanescens]